MFIKDSLTVAKATEALVAQFKKHNLVSEPPLGAFFGANAGNLEHIKDFEEKYYAYLFVGVVNGKLKSELCESRRGDCAVG